jgi:predicted 3-demethylubiquinone-9 3-methyltransferase (glyoxalase superfamily)
MPNKITPCLWFDNQAEDAARFYISVFKNSKINEIAHYPEAAGDIGRASGSVMIVSFELDGQAYTALNGGPEFQFTEAISLQVDCATQEEVDYFWDRLSEGGRTQQCGWLKDKFGLSWQIVPTIVPEVMNHPDKAKREAAFKAMMEMEKPDIAALQRAVE